MAFLIIAFISAIFAIWTKSFKHAKRIEKTRKIYKEEGIEFPYQTMGAVDSQILFYRQQFIESSESNRLKEERIELSKDYVTANFSPIKLGIKVLRYYSYRSYFMDTRSVRFAEYTRKRRRRVVNRRRS
jgi:hypothetical protein